jgi:hypothetical protein
MPCSSEVSVMGWPDSTRKASDSSTLVCTLGGGGGGGAHALYFQMYDKENKFKNLKFHSFREVQISQ